VPQAVLGGFLGARFSVCDGMVYAELGAAMPGAGGSYIISGRLLTPAPGVICFLSSFSGKQFSSLRWASPPLAAALPTIPAIFSAD